MNQRRRDRSDLAAYGPPAGLTPNRPAPERNESVGDRASRLVCRDGANVIPASVALRRRPKSRSIYEHLRLPASSRNARERYVSDVDGCHARSGAGGVPWRKTNLDTLLVSYRREANSDRT